MLVTKPYFDRDGIDLLLLGDIGELIKVGFIQSKGRSINANQNSNITVCRNYVKDNFSVFLYILPPSKAENLYCFFPEDLLKWKIKGNDYYLNIPNDYLTDSYFQEHLFSDNKINRIKQSLKSLDNGYGIDYYFNGKNSFISYEYSKWITTNLLPNFETLSYIFTKWDDFEAKLYEEVFLLVASYYNSDSDNIFDVYPSYEFVLSNIISKINIEDSIFKDNEIIDVSYFTSGQNDWYIEYNNYLIANIELNVDNKLVNGIYLYTKSIENTGYELFLEKENDNPLLFIRYIYHNTKNDYVFETTKIIEKYKKKDF
jgi:hypothetical protein